LLAYPNNLLSEMVRLSTHYDRPGPGSRHSILSKSKASSCSWSITKSHWVNGWMVVQHSDAHLHQFVDIYDTVTQHSCCWYLTGACASISLNTLLLGISEGECIRSSWLLDLIVMSQQDAFPGFMSVKGNRLTASSFSKQVPRTGHRTEYRDQSHSRRPCRCDGHL
jgi:hypothetical protein